MNNVKTLSNSLEKSSQEYSFSNISVSQIKIMASRDENNNNDNNIIINFSKIAISSPHLSSFILTTLNNQHIKHFLTINKLFLFSFIFLFISSPKLFGSATPIATDSQIILPVGSIFMLEDNLANELSPRQQLPLWLRRESSGKKRYFGIPQMRDDGIYQLMFQSYF